MELSKKLWERAVNSLAGGVNSPVRAFKAVGGIPVFIDKGEGAYLYDVDGNKYIDFMASWGPLILGHAHPDVLTAVKEKLKKGFTFGAPTQVEVELAELVKKAFPSIELIRFVNSGTEATMSAIRLARGYTGRDKIVKFEGCYHGHSDYLLTKAGSGLTTFSLPDSVGVPVDFVKNTIVIPYNDIDSLEKIFNKYGSEIACVIVEPIAGNMGTVLPEIEFLNKLRELTASYGSVLIFDEVITGFRVSIGGAQKLYNISPDLTCLGKIVGGGFPVGAFGGKKEIMEKLAPLGPVYQAGTLSGNPIAMTAGLATVKFLFENQPYKLLEENTEYFVENLKRLFENSGIKVTINYVGSMFSFFFKEPPVKNYSDVKASDSKIYVKLFHLLLKNGIYCPPSPYETWFVSVAHNRKILDNSLEIFDRSIKELIN